MRTLRSLPLVLVLALTGGLAAAADGPVRDWSAIDTNKDGLISPEEMEAWLKTNPGPLKK